VEIEITVEDIVRKLENLAAPSLAMEWDNVGLMLGQRDQKVKKALLCLDISRSVVEKAIEMEIDLIISHHPLIFKPINKITDPLFLKLVKSGISVYSAHTNLDVSPQGVNKALAELFGLKNTSLLSNQSGNSLYQIAVYVPEEQREKVEKAVFSAGAGVVGNYRECLNSYPVTGQFKPVAGAKPYLGKQNKLEKVKEIKLEFLCDSIALKSVIKALLKAHPYETPVYGIYSQENRSLNFGLGLVGELENPISLMDFSYQVKSKLHTPTVRLWQAHLDKSTHIQKVAVCGGSGRTLVKTAEQKADVYVTGDLDYHTMIESKIPLIDAGHFYTEYPVLKILESVLSDTGIEIIRLSINDHDISSEIFL